MRAKITQHTVCVLERSRQGKTKKRGARRRLQKPNEGKAILTAVCLLVAKKSQFVVKKQKQFATKWQPSAHDNGGKEFEMKTSSSSVCSLGYNLTFHNG